MQIKLFLCTLFFSASLFSMQYPVPRAPVSYCPEIRINIQGGRITPEDMLPTDLIEDCGQCLAARLCDHEYAPRRSCLSIAACGAWGCIFGSPYALYSGIGLASLAAAYAGMSSVYTDTKAYIRNARYDEYVRLLEEGNLDQYTAATLAKKYWPKREKNN